MKEKDKIEDLELKKITRDQLHLKKKFESKGVSKEGPHTLGQFKGAHSRGRG